MKAEVSEAPVGIIERVGRILVVDDEAQNRELLRALLEASGHSVIESKDGEEALKCVRETPPDVVLLDFMMPGMDGFQVCRSLKDDPATAAIPVLLVTSVTDRESRLVGIKAGANDFLSKPVDREDLLLRVGNAVCTKRLFNQLQQSYERLQRLETLRDNLTHMIIHDLRSPLTGILGCLQLLEIRGADRLTSDDQELLRNASSSTIILTELISSILDVNRFEAGEMPLDLVACDLAQLASDAVRPLQSRAQLKQIQLIIGHQKTPAYCDRLIVGRIIANLVSNALKFTEQRGSVCVAFEQEPHCAKVIVTDTGHGIPEEYLEKIFHKFTQVKARKQNEIYSTGLGLTFCKLAVESHGGSIGVESKVGVGSRFWFTLPKNL